MEFLKIIKKRRSLINEFIYVTLNIGLAVTLMILVRVTGSLWPAFMLVLISKWRIFAVRPQFWFANIQANLVSVIISVSYVVFLYVLNSTNIGESQTLILQSLLAITDVCWLIFLKPQSKRKYVVAQAGVGLFVGVMALYAVSYGWIASPVVILTWLIGYATARHVLSNYDEEDHIVLLSLAWGFVMAEIGWLAYHWTIAYRLPIITNVLIPQVSMIVLGLGFLAYKIYNSYYHFQKIRLADIILPLIFVLAIICVLVFGLNSVTTGVI